MLPSTATTVTATKTNKKWSTNLEAEILIIFSSLVIKLVHVALGSIIIIIEKAGPYEKKLNLLTCPDNMNQQQQPSDDDDDD